MNRHLCNIFQGMRRVLELFPSSPEYIVPTKGAGPAADAKALRGDWMRVGADMNRSIWLASGGVLMNNYGQYGGKYVAIRSFKSKKVSCSGSEPAEVYKQAKAKGLKHPVVFYVHRKDKTYIY